MADPTFPIQVRTLPGLETVLAGELTALGAQGVVPGSRVVQCQGDLKLLYRANVFCRTAIRVLRPLATFPARDEKALYEGIRAIEWKRWLSPDDTLAVDALVRSSFTTHSLYLAQLTKDAIVDQFRDRTGRRPSVELRDPDVRVQLWLHEDTADVSLDSSGESLHRRGYRKVAGEAPINEVLAAGILMLSGWDGSGPLLDPMCGSGTLPIEAALIARQIAPGLIRKGFGYQRWPDYEVGLHVAALNEARRKVKSDVAVSIVGRDQDASVLELARQNAARAGVEAGIQFEPGDFFAPEAAIEKCGTLVMNPPYDERLSVSDIGDFYGKIGDRLKRKFGGWKAYVLAGNLEGTKHFGLRSSKRITLFNGPIECRLLEYELKAASSEAKGPVWREAPIDSPEALARAEAYSNRLKKMAKHLEKWAKREGVSCYRLYDRDMPEVPFIVDSLGGALHVAEMGRDEFRKPGEHQRWIELILQKTSEALDVPRDRISFKERKPQKGTTQYTAVSDEQQLEEVQEAGHKFLVNLSDYVDVGLFLDHRNTRAMVEERAKGKDVLNLYCYTGSFTVYAAAGGAKSTVSVDTSQTYLRWAEKNLALNRLLGSQHRFLRSDCMEFLEHSRELYDLAIVDPPTFSNNRSSGRVFDVQLDHVPLLEAVLKRLRPGGEIFFSSNFRKFKFEGENLPGVEIQEITHHTVPPDFQRQKSHRSWLIKKA